MLGKLLKCAHVEGKDWKQELDSFLLQYRTTPHVATGETPANMLFNHKVKNDIPSVSDTCNSSPHQQQINARDATYKSKFSKTPNKQKMVKFQKGDEVLIKNMNRNTKIEPFYETKLYKIIKVNHHKLTLHGNKKTLERNIAHCKKYTRSHETRVKQKRSHDSTHTKSCIDNNYLVINLDDQHAEQNESDHEEQSSNTESESESTYSSSSEDSTIPYDISENESETDQKSVRKRKLPIKLMDYELG